LFGFNRKLEAAPSKRTVVAVVPEELIRLLHVGKHVGQRMSCWGILMKAVAGVRHLWTPTQERAGSRGEQKTALIGEFQRHGLSMLFLVLPIRFYRRPVQYQDPSPGSMEGRVYK
jgi:hypothetical protein